ncbi:hypothetical protein [Rasiella sp. SM2506]|uniref:hypothetical protein n=1 Tax=Rasiella sp. SM2506 TaxID=3423914 RepID=UPI003D79DF8E
MKKSILLGLLVVGIVFTSCKSTIPTTDNVYPTVYFQFLPTSNSGEDIFIIKGEGTVKIGNQAVQPFNFDSDVLYLKKDNVYNTLIGGSDDKDPSNGKGAVLSASLIMPSNRIINISNTAEITSGKWDESSLTTTPNTRTFRYTSDPDDIRDGTVISPNITPRLQNISGSGIDDFEFTLTVTDYFDHATAKTLVVRITNAASHIGFGEL